MPDAAPPAALPPTAAADVTAAAPDAVGADSVGADSVASSDVPVPVDAHGLTLGRVATDATVEAWTAALGIPCVDGMLASTATRVECRPPSAAAPVGAGELGFARVDIQRDGTPTELAVRRHYREIASALADYEATRDALREAWGPERQSEGSADIGTLRAGPARAGVRFETAFGWIYVEIMHGIAELTVVNETWHWDY